MKLRITALICALCLCLGFTACGGSNRPPIGTVNGEEISYSEFAYYANYIKSSIESQNNASIDTLWDLDLGGTTVSDTINQNALNAILDVRAARDIAAEYSVTLSEDDLKALKSQKAETIRSAGTKEFNDFLKSIGMSDEQYDAVMQDNMLANKLYNYFYGETGTLLPSDEELYDEFVNGYFTAKHILVSTLDDSGAALPNAELEAAEELATAVGLKAKAGEDFDQLIADYGSDPGMESNPGGYTFTAGDMVQEFEDAVRSLEIGGISEPVLSMYGYHIIQRLPLDEEYFEENIDVIRDAYRVSAYSDMLTERRNALAVATTDEYDTFDVREAGN